MKENITLNLKYYSDVEWFTVVEEQVMHWKIYNVMRDGLIACELLDMSSQPVFSCEPQKMFLL